MLKILLIYNEIERLRIFMLPRDILSQDEYERLKGVHHRYINAAGDDDCFDMEWLPDFIEIKSNREGQMLYDSQADKSTIPILVGNQTVEIIATGFIP